MPPLNGTLTLSQMNDVAVTIGNNLNFNVPRLVDVFFEEHSLVAKSRTRFAAGAAETLAALFVVAGNPHALSAAAGAGLYHDWIADVVG